jgi:hypothetical protein
MKLKIPSCDLAQKPLHPLANVNTHHQYAPTSVNRQPSEFPMGDIIPMATGQCHIMNVLNNEQNNVSVAWQRLFPKVT